MPASIPTAIAEQSAPTKASSPGATILVADDSVTVLRVLQRALKAAGYEVLLAENGRQTVDRALAERPDLIVLDIDMPELDGYQVCEELLSNAQWNGDTPVVFFTGCEEQNLETLGNLMGGFLSKPADPTQLIDTIESLLD